MLEEPGSTLEDMGREGLKFKTRIGAGASETIKQKRKKGGWAGGKKKIDVACEAFYTKSEASSL